MLKRRRSRPRCRSSRGGDSAGAIGAELRAARTARGEDLNDIAAFLRIRPSYLEAWSAGEAARCRGAPTRSGSCAPTPTGSGSTDRRWRHG